MNWKFWQWSRPLQHRTNLVKDEWGHVVGQVSYLEKEPWFQRLDDDRATGFTILGLTFQIGDCGNQAGVAIETRSFEHGLTVLNIRTPSITMRRYMRSQWGAIPHWYRPIRETMVYIRHGQEVPKYEHTGGEHKVIGTRTAWCVDVGKCEHVFDAIKWFITWRDKRYKGSGFRSGDYPVGWKLTYRRKNNDTMPYNSDILLWGDKVLLWGMD